MAVSAVSYNIQYGVGLDGAYALDRIVAAVRGADVICLQEVTRGHAGNGGVDMVAALGAALPTHFHVYHPAADIDIGSTLIEGRAVDRRFQFGNMILSRWPPRSVRRHLLPRTWRRDKLNLQRGAIEALIETTAGPIRFYSVHLDHVDPAERMAQIGALRPIALDFAASGGAITGASGFGLQDMPDNGDFVLMGDFNCEPGSDDYGALVAGGALVDASAADPGWTWRPLHDARPEPFKRLDFAFCNPALAGRIGRVHVDREAAGSDHVPVWIEIAA